MRRLLLAASVTAALGAASPAALAAPAEPAPITDVERYADAEQANPQAADFTGGSTVVFIGSTTTMILALILLLLII